MQACDRCDVCWKQEKNPEKSLCVETSASEGHYRLDCLPLAFLLPHHKYKRRCRILARVGETRVIVIEKKECRWFISGVYTRTHTSLTEIMTGHVGGRHHLIHVTHVCSRFMLSNCVLPFNWFQHDCGSTCIVDKMRLWAECSCAKLTLKMGGGGRQNPSKRVLHPL